MDAPRCPRMKPMALDGTCTAAISGSLGPATRPLICWYGRVGRVGLGSIRSESGIQIHGLSGGLTDWIVD